MAQIKVEDIKKRLETADNTVITEILNEYRTDTRSSVKKLIEKYEKKFELYQKELERTERMKEFEYKYEEYAYICGIDEVGRGPLAGPVVAGAVILPKDSDILYLNDSKQLSEKMREKLYDQIMEKAIAVGIGIVSPAVVDEKNILQATYEAMRIAISQLSVKPDVLLNDAVHIPGVSIKQVSIVKGDARSISIAAASIVAKVTRDRLMQEFHKLYPEYGFDRNKGYGSVLHIEQLKKIGPCSIHRASFIKNFV